MSHQSIDKLISYGILALAFGQLLVQLNGFVLGRRLSALESRLDTLSRKSDPPDLSGKAS